MVAGEESRTRVAGEEEELEYAYELFSQLN